jgi:hypothetical protein
MSLFINVHQFTPKADHLLLFAAAFKEDEDFKASLALLSELDFC